MGLLGNLKTVWRNRKAIKAASQALDQIKEAQVKDGLKTTEFWLTAVGTVGTLLSSLNGVLDTAVQVCLYTVLRSLVKTSGQPPQEPPKA
jgi:tRNA C32,U32 (ribose-2'-O)-methylase TrmJ